MFRPVMQSARCAARSLVSQRAVIARPAFRSSLLQSKSILPATPISAVRCYASGSMSKDEVQGRILELLSGFDKVKDASKITASSHFSNDLGLDSLDTVEVVMAIEEEFSIEIPDKDADQIHSVDKAIEYILNQPDAH